MLSYVRVRTCVMRVTACGLWTVALAQFTELFYSGCQPRPWRHVEGMGRIGGESGVSSAHCSLQPLG